MYTCLHKYLYCRNNIIPGAKKLRSTHDDVLHLQDDDEHRQVDRRFASLDR